MEFFFNVIRDIYYSFGRVSLNRNEILKFNTFAPVTIKISIPEKNSFIRKK